MIPCSRCAKHPAMMEVNKTFLCGDCYYKTTGRCPICMSTGCTHYDKKE